MDEIVRFLRSYPPFDTLPLTVVQQIAEDLQIEYVSAGEIILHYGGAPAQFLGIVCKGAVDLLRDDELIDTLGPGEAFGHPSLTRRQSPLATVRAHGEVLVYQLPAATFRRLLAEQPAFAAFFAASAAQRLEQHLAHHRAAADTTLFQTPLRDLVSRPPITVSAEATVAAAARLMRSERVSCLIVDHQPPGIVTDRDLRNRVLAAELPPATPISTVMTAPFLSLTADAMAFEGLLLMLERGVHHLPLLNPDGSVLGLVTHTDILRRQSNSPLFLPRQLQRAESPADLRRYADQVARTVTTLLDAGAHVVDIGRVVAVAHDALLVRLLQDAEQQLGPPPVPYAWLVLGSEGRLEQTLRTDQDNALVYHDDATPAQAAYFPRLAAHVVAQLVDCGFPRCPGEVMATNPDWCRPLAAWQRYFTHWISVPDEEALLRAAIFFDYRQVYGSLPAEAALHRMTDHAADQRIFMARLARTALRNPAPLTLFHGIATERRGTQRRLLDLKLRGTALIVDLARLFALEARTPQTNTVARLRAAEQAAVLHPREAANLIHAFELLARLRLQHQQSCLAAGLPVDNQVNLDQLSHREHRELKESLQAVHHVQRGVAELFQTGRIA
jgi:CBS domain-containing protein